SSTTPGSSSWMSLRISAIRSPRQSPRAAIFLSIRSDALMESDDLATTLRGLAAVTMAFVATFSGCFAAFLPTVFFVDFPVIGSLLYCGGFVLPTPRASRAAPPGGIRQREQVQPGQQEQGEREQRHVGHPDDRLLLCQGNESHDHCHRKDDGQPAGDLSNPRLPVH